MKPERLLLVKMLYYYKKIRNLSVFLFYVNISLCLTITYFLQEWIGVLTSMTYFLLSVIFSWATVSFNENTYENANKEIIVDSHSFEDILANTLLSKIRQTKQSDKFELPARAKFLLPLIPFKLIFIIAVYLYSYIKGISYFRMIIEQWNFTWISDDVGSTMVYSFIYIAIMSYLIKVLNNLFLCTNFFYFNTLYIRNTTVSSEKLLYQSIMPTFGSFGKINTLINNRIKKIVETTPTNMLEESKLKLNGRFEEKGYFFVIMLGEMLPIVLPNPSTIGTSFSKGKEYLTSDKNWKNKFKRILSKTDLVVVNITNFTDNLEWEICQIEKYLKNDRIILICESKKSESIFDYQTNLSSSISDNKIFFYTDTYLGRWILQFKVSFYLAKLKL